MLLLKVVPRSWLEPECCHYQHWENTHHAWQWVLFPQRLSGMRIGMIDLAHLCLTQDGCLRIGLCLWTREEVRVWGSLS